MTDLIEPNLAHMRAAGRSADNVYYRRRMLLALDRELPKGIDQATTEELEAWLGREGWKPATRATYWYHLVDFYRWAVRAGKMDFDPSEDIAQPRRPAGLPRPVSADQLRTALRLLGQPWRLAVLLAAVVGMRAGEIARCRREDFTDGVVLIVGKGGRYRSVPVGESAWAAVERLPAGPVIRWHGEAVTPHWLTQTTAKHLDRIGLADVTLHRFRHWFGTTVQREYRDLRVTQELLGHSSPATTAGYAAVTDGQRRLAIQTLSAALTITLQGAA
jgi:integrase